MMLRLTLFVCLSFFVGIESLKIRNDFFIKDIPCDAPDGKPESDPLYLTPYIESGNIAEAQKLSQVTTLPTTIQSHSGLITVNKQYAGHTFFWYFPSQRDPSSDPVIMWLQGGPGSSSMFGLFSLHGPLILDADLNLSERDLTWNKNYSMIYVDNPVGTGFSVAEQVEAFVTNQEEVGRDLFEFLQQFFTLFPDLQARDFYVAGESYGGKYVPAISHYIYKHNADATVKINFKGCAIGNGWTHPLVQSNYGNFLENVGLVDKHERNEIDQFAANTIELIKQEDWHGAVDAFFSYAFGYFYEVSGLNNHLNYIVTNLADELDYYGKYLRLADVKDSIHVGSIEFQGQSGEVSSHLRDDFMKSTKTYIEDLLNGGVRVLIYVGHLDIIVAYPLTEVYVKGLNWTHTEEFSAAEREAWLIDDKVAGYRREFGGLSHVMVHAASHFVPYDQPVAGLQMIDTFISGN